MIKLKSKKILFLFLSILIFNNSHSQEYFFINGIKHDTRINSEINHLEPDSSVYSEYENGSFIPVHFYKHRYGNSKNKIASDIEYNGNPVYDSFTYNFQGKLTGHYTFDDFGLLQSEIKKYNDDGLLTNRIIFIRENDQLIKSFHDSFTYFKQGNKLSGVLHYNLINIQGSIWEETSYYGFSYGGSEYPQVIEYRKQNPLTQAMHFHSLLQNLRWDLNEKSEFFDKQLTRFDLFTDSSGTVVYKGYDSMHVENNKVIKKYSYRNGGLESLVSQEWDLNGNMIKQILEQPIGNNFDTIVIYSNEYIYASSGEILEHLSIEDNKITSHVSRKKNNYYYSGTSLYKDKIEARLYIYPNPAKNYIVIDSPSEIIEMEIRDINGKEVFNQKKLSNNQINIDELKAGLYIIYIRTINGVKSEKLLIQ